MRTFVALFCVAGLLGCKTDKPAANTKGSGSATGSGSAGAAGSGPAGSGSPGSAAVPVSKGPPIALPKSDGTPPTKTTKPLDKDDFERMAKIDYPGFEKSIINQSNTFDVRYLTSRPRLATTVTMTKCFTCTPIDLDKWKAKEATLKMLLPEELRAKADTIWELGKTEVNGTPVIYTYQFGMQSSNDDHNNPIGVFSDAYILYWNDGVNQIRAVAEYKDDWAAREDMLSIAPKEDLEKLAKAFFDVSTHAW